MSWQCVNKHTHITHTTRTSSRPYIYNAIIEVTANNNSLLLFVNGSVNTLGLPLPLPVNPLPLSHFSLSLSFLSCSLFPPVCSYCSGLALYCTCWLDKANSHFHNRRREERGEKEVEMRRGKDSWKPLGQHKSQPTLDNSPAYSHYALQHSVALCG